MAAALALALVGCDRGSTTPPSAVAVEGARTDGDRGLVLSFTGGSPTLDPSDPCWTGYRPEVAEAGGRVTVTIRAVPSKVPMPANFACHLVGYFRTAAVTLDRPLGQRAVLDGSTGQELRPFDGDAVLRPRALPAGWELLREGPGPDPDGRSWSQTWGPPAGAPRAGVDCADLSGPVTLTQSPAPAGEFPAVGDVTVRGTAGDVDLDRAGGPIRLVWREAGQHLALDASRACADTLPAGAAFLLEFAGSLA